MLLFAVKMKKVLSFENAIFLAFVISLIAAVYSAANYRNYNTVDEADVVITKLTDGNGAISLLKGNEVDEKKLRMLDQMNYDQVKAMLGVKKDFCVYFEDQDGNLIKVDSVGYGIGSSNIYINGKPCG